MPLFGGVKCFICMKSGRKNEFIYDEKLQQYFCCEEHRQRAFQMESLIEKAQAKGLSICPKCLKEIQPTAFACKHCKVILSPIEGYELNRMCPFVIASVGKTELGQGQYVWQHMRCIQEYCALWDFDLDKCSFLTKNQ